MWVSTEVRDVEELFLLLLSVCDDVADVLVVNVASHIRGEGSPEVLHLQMKRK